MNLEEQSVNLVQTRERLRKARNEIEPLVSGDKCLVHPSDPLYPEIRDMLNRLIGAEYEVLLQITRSLHR